MRGDTFLKLRKIEGTQTMDEPVEGMDSDENAVRAILSRVFSQGRRHRHSSQEVASYIERKRAKVNALIDKYKLQAELGRGTLQ